MKDKKTKNVHSEKVAPPDAKPLLPAVFLPDYKGQKQTKVMYDRTRTVNYNGSELWMNTYECSSCKTVYHFEQIKHSFCPFCGKKYRYEADVSV